MSRGRAYAIAHLPKQDQPFHLYEFYEDVLYKAQKQYWSCGYGTWEGYARWCALCIKYEGMIPTEIDPVREPHP